MKSVLLKPIIKATRFQIEDQILLITCDIYKRTKMAKQSNCCRTTRKTTMESCGCIVPKNLDKSK